MIIKSRIILETIDRLDESFNVELKGLYDNDRIYVEINNTLYSFNTRKSSTPSQHIVKEFKKKLKLNRGQAIKYLETECGTGQLTGGPSPEWKLIAK